MEDNIDVFQNTSISVVDKDRIISRLPEFHRGSAIIGHSTSQTSYSLQTMNMISDSPMSRMKQCLAQINKRFNALRESHFNVEKMKLQISELDSKSDKFSKLEADEKSSLVEQIIKTMNASFREIGMFQDMYDSIMKNNNIPENWTEKDFEAQELDNMIKSAYRLAIQDLSHSGRVSQACVEYWEQLGIHPQVGEIETRMYMSGIAESLEKGEVITIQHMYFFLDAMVTKHKADWKNVISRIGLDAIGSERYMAENVRDINK